MRRTTDGEAVAERPALLVAAVVIALLLAEDLHRQIDGAEVEMEIAVYDLLPVYLGMDTTRLAVDLFNDPHPNEIAHRIASDKLLDYLLKRQWLPVEDPGEPPGPASAALTEV